MKCGACHEALSRMARGLRALLAGDCRLSTRCSISSVGRWVRSLSISASTMAFACFGSCFRSSARKAAALQGSGGRRGPGEESVDESPRKLGLRGAVPVCLADRARDTREKPATG